MRRANKGASAGDRTHAIVVIGIAFVLVFSLVSTIATIGLPAALAEKGGNSGEKGNSDHGKGDKSKTKQETNTSSNSTESDEEENSSKKGKGNGKESRQSTKHSWEERLNQTADEIFKKHLKMNAGFSGPYTANMTYTLDANGTANAIGNSSYVGDAQLSLDMSVWKSRPTQVQLDVTGGELTVDGQSMEVHSGHAHYWSNTNRMLIVAFVIEGGNSEDDASDSNQTSTTNQTSTDNTIESEDDEGLSEPQVRILKLWMTIPGQDVKLPTEELADPIQIDVMSPQSKLASKWFLEMDGEVALST